MYVHEGRLGWDPQPWHLKDKFWMYFYISFNLLSAGRSRHGVMGLETVLQGNLEAA